MLMLHSSHALQPDGSRGAGAFHEAHIQDAKLFGFKLKTV